jgi:hypothetical protein
MADLKTYTQSGTLFKCGSNNNWVAYYTPFTYPHPLAIGSTLPPPPPAIPGDINGDGRVDAIDLRIVASDFGKTSGFNNIKSDTNNNGIVDIYDAVFVASRFT